MMTQKQSAPDDCMRIDSLLTENCRVDLFSSTTVPMLSAVSLSCVPPSSVCYEPLADIDGDQIDDECNENAFAIDDDCGGAFAAQQPDPVLYCDCDVLSKDKRSISLYEAQRSVHWMLGESLKKFPPPNESVDSDYTINEIEQHLQMHLAEFQQRTRDRKRVGKAVNQAWRATHGNQSVDISLRSKIERDLDALEKRIQSRISRLAQHQK